MLIACVLYLPGIQTSEDAKFYGLSAKFEKAFSNEGQNLVIQFSVKHEQNIDCGGGYAKVQVVRVLREGTHDRSLWTDYLQIVVIFVDFLLLGGLGVSKGVIGGNIPFSITF